MMANNDWQSSDNSLTKLKVAELHVLTSIQLIALEAHPLSIQLAALSADNIIQDVARHREVLLPHADDLVVYPQYVKQWKTAKRRAANFGKHADRDPEGIYDGPKVERLVSLNDIQTVMNILGLESLNHPKPPIMMQFFYLTMVQYPHLVRWKEIAATNAQLHGALKQMPNPDRFGFVGALRRFLNAADLYPNML